MLVLNNSQLETQRTEQTSWQFVLCPYYYGMTIFNLCQIFQVFIRQFWLSWDSAHLTCDVVVFLIFSWSLFMGGRRTSAQKTVGAVLFKVLGFSFAIHDFILARI